MCVHLMFCIFRRTFGGGCSEVRGQHPEGLCLLSGHHHHLHRVRLLLWVPDLDAVHFRSGPRHWIHFFVRLHTAQETERGPSESLKLFRHRKREKMSEDEFYTFVIIGV